MALLARYDDVTGNLFKLFFVIVIKKSKKNVYMYEGLLIAVVKAICTDEVLGKSSPATFYVGIFNCHNRKYHNF